MNDLLTVFIIAMIAAFCALLWRGQGVHERAVLATRRFCKSQQLIFLDHTVALRKLRLKKDRENKLCIARTYQFEFTTTGEQRYTGTILMMGRKPDSIDVPVHNIS